MARTERDLEAYLHALGKSWNKLEDGTYVIGKEDRAPTAVRVTGTLLVARVLIGDAPSGKPETEAKLFRRLLQLNATELVYSSYGLESGHILLSAALEMENLDLNELEAVLSDIDLGVVRHVPELRELCQDA
ncbi:MAG: hypothetical protein CSA75_02940 [Sorangium cellulosum]|nr:MAG: hypothetical protein CSA75_02940 [Sorangium cellulosum]